MAGNLCKTLGFGVAIPTLQAHLVTQAGVLVGSSVAVGSGIVHLGDAQYIADFSVPDGYTRGAVVWDPNDGVHGILADEINLSQAVATVDLSGLGSNPLTVRVQDQNGVGLPGQIITVRDAGGGVVGWAVTGSSGQWTFNLAAGNYTIYVSTTPHYTTPAPQSKAVPTDTPVVLVSQLQTPTPPASPGLCTIQVQHMLAGVPVENAVISAELQGLNSGLPHQIQSLVKNVALTNESGYGELQLPWSSQFTSGTGEQLITVMEPDGVTASVSATVLIPDQSSIWLDELLVNV